MAAASAARACSTDADNSSADSSATTSPARTGSPFCTLIAASWPPTSGATRISVVRTTPTMGSTASDRHNAYAPAPAAMRLTPTAMMAMRVLGMCPSPLDHERGHHCEREIDGRQDPKAAPGARHLPQACAELIDADDTVDGEIGWKYVARGKDVRGDCFARPGKTGQEQLRQAGAQKNECRGLRVLEPGAERLAHEAGRKNEDRGQRKQLRGLT